MSINRYDEYKEAEADSLGRLPKHWNYSLLKRWITVKSGDMISSDEETESGTPIIGGNGIRSYTNKSNTPGNTLVIGRVGAKCGCVHHIQEPFWASEHAFRVVEKKSINKRYLFHLLSSLDLNQFAIKTAQPLLNTEIVETQWIFNPPLSEQTQIARFLDRETAKIDALIAEQQRLIELLQEKRQAVISHAVTKGLNPNAPMKDSGVEWLGEVPEHWEVLELKRLKMEGSSITYGIVQAGPHQENGVPYIRTSDMSGDRLLLETCQRASPEIDEAYARSKVSEGDLVIAIRATVGKTLEVPKELDGANLTQGTAKFSPGERVTSGFMKLAFASSYSQAQIASIAKGATFLEITLDALRRLAFAVPPKDEARQITHYLSERCAVIDTLTTNSEEACSLLKERRSALISAAVTGQIDVRGLAAEVAA